MNKKSCKAGWPVVLLNPQSSIYIWVLLQYPGINYAMFEGARYTTTQFALSSNLGHST